jgi:uncharacterized protein (TIGR03084 family)
VADDYHSLIEDLAAEHAELDAVVAGLSEAEWSTLTPADGWTVRDSILHLALTDDVAALAAADPAGFETYRGARRGGDDRFATARHISGSDVLDLWRANRVRLLEALRSVDARRRITWFGPPMSAMSHATARLMETWAHGQDVLDTLGLERRPGARLRHIAHLGVRTRAYSYQQHGMSVPNTDVRVVLLAPDGGEWSWGDPSAVDRVVGPALDFCRVVVQRRHVDDTQLRTEGPHAREWLLIAQAFAGRAGAGRRAGQFKGAGDGTHFAGTGSTTSVEEEDDPNGNPNEASH